ncbi:hypothetical protein HG535_0A05230 [Zygotorulaspora mrakii]|uniref:Amino acid transporter transmembrane domain-containing protein n=1 Tax=Zygotorulaspora mrakii TaxID=42260 RepID=A0A7H9AYD0_ZYGMR|nr:uncharacterized protein HG535_0A05230 [Zygotorulaspora mrakii]QLG70582.1 hypothetical protein HG535_0A05230 [Zygotorulaspora mrakii]
MAQSSEQRPLNGSSSNGNNDGMTSSHPHVTYVSIPIHRNSDYGEEIDQPGSFGTFHTRRQSILDQPIGSFRGVNSLSRFATSLRRANSFRHIDVRPDVERNYFEDSNDELYDPETMAPSHDGRRLSVAISKAGNISVRPSITNFDNSIRQSGTRETEDYGSTGFLHQHDNSSLYRPAFSISDSIGGIGSNVGGGQVGDVESIMVKRVNRGDGEVVTILAGQSTGPQTIFNSINVLIGIGLFALPLGLKHAGWIPGTFLLVLLALGTFCSAELLSRCLDTDPTMISYADLGYAAFGSKGRALISCLFTLDLLGCGVSLIILFGDSLNALFPKYSSNFYKIIGFFAVTPPVFIPLSILSNISFLGIMSTVGTVLLVTFCGIWKKSAPGSLIEPMPTHLWPSNLKDFCLSIGLLSACWGGHAVFPNLKSDMRHPEKFKDCLKQTYKITTFVDIGTAIVGFLMFGGTVFDEITRNILLTEGYPQFVYVLLSVLMSIIPIAKTPLNARPIISVLDIITGVQGMQNKPDKPFAKKFLVIFNRIFINALFVLIAILFPKFDKLIAFLGAGLCFAICLILPCMFYIRICKATIRPWEKVLCHVTIGVSAALAILGVGAAIIS